MTHDVTRDGQRDTCYTTHHASVTICLTLHNHTDAYYALLRAVCRQIAAVPPPPHLAAGHVGHGAVGLDGLQLVQAPVQLLQRLARPPDIVFVWKAKISSEGHNILFCMSEPEGSERARWEKGRWGPDTMDARLKIFFISTMLLG